MDGLVIPIMWGLYDSEYGEQDKSQCDHTTWLMNIMSEAVYTDIHEMSTFYGYSDDPEIKEECYTEVTQVYTPIIIYIEPITDYIARGLQYLDDSKINIRRLIQHFPDMMRIILHKWLTNYKEPTYKPLVVYARSVNIMRISDGFSLAPRVPFSTHTASEARTIERMNNIFFGIKSRDDEKSD